MKNRYGCNPINAIAYLVLLLLSQNVYCSIDLEKKVIEANHNFPIAEQVDGSAIEKKRDAYLNKHDFSLGQNITTDGQGKITKSFYIGWGQSSIKASRRRLRL